MSFISGGFLVVTCYKFNKINIPIFNTKRKPLSCRAVQSPTRGTFRKKKNYIKYNIVLCCMQLKERIFMINKKEIFNPARSKI